MNHPNVNNVNNAKQYDLNVHNYSLPELESLLQLPLEKNYGQSLVYQNMHSLIQCLKQNDALDPHVVDETTSFLLDAAQVISASLARHEKLKEEELKETKEFHQQFLQVVSESFIPNYNMHEVPVVQKDGSHMVQEKKGTVYTQSYPSEYFPGVINPLKKRISRQFLNIDTRFRDNYFSTPSTNFNFNLPIKFTSVVSVQLTSFEMVLSAFSISRQAGNNFFNLKTQFCGVGEETLTVVVPDGNYTDASLVAYLNDFVMKAGSYFAHLLFTIDLSADGLTGTGRMVVGIREGGVPFDFTLDFQANINGEADFGSPLPLKLGWLMGFRNGIYTHNATYISEGIVDFKGLRYFYLVFNDYNNNVDNNFYSAFQSSVLNQNILARLTVGSAPFQVLNQNNLNVVTFPRQYYGPVDIQKINIQLLDEYGRVINLNHMDYSFCITLQTVYDL